MADEICRLAKLKSNEETSKKLAKLLEVYEKTFCKSESLAQTKSQHITQTKLVAALLNVEWDYRTQYEAPQSLEWLAQVES